MDTTSAVIHIVAAVIVDSEGRVLVVRKRGSLIFIQPGGKRERGESSMETLEREVYEELGVRINIATAERLGDFEDRAVNEPGRRVRAETFIVDIEGVPEAMGEIEEVRWIDPNDCGDVPLAPLSRNLIFPSMRGALKQREKKRRDAHAG